MGPDNCRTPLPHCRVRSHDQGTQYRTGMYFHSKVQEAEARIAFEREASSWRSSGRDVVTEVRPAGIF